MNIRGCYSTLRSVKIIVRDLPCRDPRKEGGEEELRSTPQQIAIRLILKARNKVQRHVVRDTCQLRQRQRHGNLVPGRNDSAYGPQIVTFSIDQFWRTCQIIRDQTTDTHCVRENT